jgi:solute carrier family 25 citrate transporter 1
METVKTKFIDDQNAPADKRKYKGFVHGKYSSQSSQDLNSKLGVSTMFRNEGIAGIYKGLFPTILKQGTNQGTRFLVFRELKNWVQGGDSKAPFTLIQSTICGGTETLYSLLIFSSCWSCFCIC